MKILITGATGLIGNELGKVLHQKGHSIVVISRNHAQAKKKLSFPCEVIEWDLRREAVKGKLNVDAVFHLLGENLTARRWNEEFKKEIFNSRVTTTKNLNSSLGSSVVFYLSASAIGIYGDQPGVSLTEQNSGDGSYLSGLCAAWENEADQFLRQQPNTTMVKIRTGIVLSPNGGALTKMLPPFKMGFGGALGNGKQYMSWIHIDDLVAMMVFALEKNKAGIFNGVSPSPITNKQFSRTLADILHRPLGPAVPKFVLKLLFGEMADVMLADQKVYPTQALNQGFKFQYTDLSEALRRSVYAGQRL